MGNGMMCATTLKSRVAQGSAKCRLAGAQPPPPPTGAVGGGGALPRWVAVVVSQIGLYSLATKLSGQKSTKNGSDDYGQSSNGSRPAGSFFHEILLALNFPPFQLYLRRDGRVPLLIVTWLINKVSIATKVIFIFFSKIFLRSVALLDSGFPLTKTQYSF